MHSLTTEARHVYERFQRLLKLVVHKSTLSMAFINYCDTTFFVRNQKTIDSHEKLNICYGTRGRRNLL